MAFVNYCKKCKAETPAVEVCPYCQKKLPKTNEHLSFGYVFSPARNFFMYNQWLRVVLIVLSATIAIVLLSEGITGGIAGIQKLITQGFIKEMFIIFVFCVAVVFLLLSLRGKEHVHCVLDKDGMHVRVYLKNPTKWQYTLRFCNEKNLELLAKDERNIPNFTLVSSAHVLWKECKRIRLWSKGLTLIAYKPKYWQALVICLPIQQYNEIVEYVYLKGKKNKCKIIEE